MTVMLYDTLWLTIKYIVYSPTNAKSIIIKQIIKHAYKERPVKSKHKILKKKEFSAIATKILRSFSFSNFSLYR